jgi:hypothetical protein
MFGFTPVSGTEGRRVREQRTPYADRTAVSLRPMVGPEIPEFLATSPAEYIADRVASGDDPAVDT